MEGTGGTHVLQILLPLHWLQHPIIVLTLTTLLAHYLVILIVFIRIGSADIRSINCVGTVSRENRIPPLG